MNWEIEYLQQEGVVYVRTWGTLTDVHANQMMIAEAVAEAEKHGATKCLIDDRDLTLEIGIVDLYYLPEAFSDLGVRHEYKVAIVFPVGSLKEENFKFYETRAANLGYTHRLFSDPDAALDWLTGGAIKEDPHVHR
jgi:hypothetical protein